LQQKHGRKGYQVTILSGDRDTFQLTSDHITVRIPRTKAGKTEVEDFVDGIIKEKAELYGINVIDLKREFRSVNVEFFLKIIEVFCCSSTIYVPTNDEFEELQKMLFVPVCDKT